MTASQQHQRITLFHCRNTQLSFSLFIHCPLSLWLSQSSFLSFIGQDVNSLKVRLNTQRKPLHSPHKCPTPSKLCIYRNWWETRKRDFSAVCVHFCLYVSRSRSLKGTFDGRRWALPFSRSESDESLVPRPKAEVSSRFHGNLKHYRTISLILTNTHDWKQPPEKAPEVLLFRNKHLLFVSEWRRSGGVTLKTKLFVMNCSLSFGSWTFIGRPESGKIKTFLCGSALWSVFQELKTERF